VKRTLREIGSALIIVALVALNGTASRAEPAQSINKLVYECAIVSSTSKPDPDPVFKAMLYVAIDTEKKSAYFLDIVHVTADGVEYARSKQYGKALTGTTEWLPGSNDRLPAEVIWTGDWLRDRSGA
jgi:hypothetical protein